MTRKTSDPLWSTDILRINREMILDTAARRFDPAATAFWTKADEWFWKRWRFCNSYGLRDSRNTLQERRGH
jgi:hypothetical protein